MDIIRGMEHINIPIPDGLPAEQREELVGWLTKQAAAALPQRASYEDEQAWQRATAQRIKAGIDAANAGEVLTSSQARRELDVKLGIKREL